MFTEFFSRYRMDALGMVKIIQPPKQNTDIFMNDCCSLSVNDYVSVEKNPHNPLFIHFPQRWSFLDA